jgi:hypothetical protein
MNPNDAILVAAFGMCGRQIKMEENIGKKMGNCVQSCLKGEPGKNGPRGLKGIGKDNSEIYVPSFQGDKGFRGDPGEPGRNGLIGQCGPKGAKGSRGAPGMSGDKGDQVVWRKYPTLPADCEIDLKTGKRRSRPYWTTWGCWTNGEPRIERSHQNWPKRAERSQRQVKFDIFILEIH